jgi:preprotein translocase subunit SecE
MADKIKLIVAFAVLGAAIVAFYYFEDQSLLARVAGLLVAAGISIAIALQAEAGRNVWSFIRESRTEIRKVVWPSRKETTQSTMLVMAMVVIVGVFLWLLDMFLGWAVRLLTGQGG